MRRLQRRALSLQTLEALEQLSAAVRRAPAAAAEARRRWSSKPAAPFAEVRATLEAMASGRARCMYCEDSAGTDIEHFWPRAGYPERAFLWENLLLACSHCNSNGKRDQFPMHLDGTPLLLDPTADEPTEHLLLTPRDGRMAARSPRGDASIQVFDLNGRRLPEGRKDAFGAAVRLLREYDEVGQQAPARAQELRAELLRFPFSGVLVWMVQIAQSPAGPLVLGQPLVDLLSRHQVAGWL